MSILLQSLRRLAARSLILVAASALLSPTLRAVVVHGTVTDPLGRPVPGAILALVQNGKVVMNARSGQDGSYQITSAATGRFFILASGHSFRQLSTHSFYGGTLDDVQQDVVLEPEWVRQSVVVTATGTPLPQAQVSASITGINKSSFQNRADMVDPMRQVPGINIVQTGQRGGLASIFIRGGNSDANAVVLDGVPMEDIGGRFDLSTLTSTGISDVEAYRGPNSVLYGSDAAAGVVSFTTPRGSTSFPSLFYEGDGGNFGTYRNEVQLGGTHSKLDYYAAFADLQTKNSLPSDEYHAITSTANIGWSPTAATQLRVTARNTDLATGLPGAIQFYGIANDAKQSDQDLFLSGTIDHKFSYRWHGLVRYGLGRKREESIQWSPTGIPDLSAGVYLGDFVTIRGANGYSVSGNAIINYFGAYPTNLNLVSNRDQLYAQTDYQITPHVTAIAGFRYEDERGAEREAAYGINETLERTNYDYMGQLQGDFRNRIYYSLGGGVEKNQLFGTVGAPHIGLSYYVVPPGSGKFKGTKINFNFAKGYKEPTLSDQFGSLYTFLQQNGGQAAIQQYGVTPIGADLSRSYDGGVEQNLFSERVLLRVTYFHNEFGNQIESVGAAIVPQLLPQLTPAQQASLEAFLQSESAYSLTLNSLSFRAQGFESEVDYGVRRNIYLRGGYTYLDSVVQRSFSSDAESPTYNTSAPFANIPIGVYSPLRGARPFRRPPHTGFFDASYTGGPFTAVFDAAFVSRSDDSTYLGGSDANFGNSLLLPNRNLDSAYAKLDAGGTFQANKWLGVYAQADNILSSQHIGPIGYPSLPFNFRMGLRLTLGHSRQ
ncbi:MAG: TonB-dependent receptor plug domain-containing protein [Acidobacteria bacterium]|nr:TonB-dependent receptor plug domain-containing protein [Acidobacteriota bacterium]